MEASMSLHPPLEGRRPQRAPVGSLKVLGYSFCQLHPCRLSVWEKLRPSSGEAGHCLALALYSLITI